MADQSGNHAPPTRRPAARPGSAADVWQGFQRASRRWARDTFSREQLINSLKSLAWVAPLSVLIWIYAERQGVFPLDNQTIPFVVRSEDPRYLVTVVYPEDKLLMATLEGPRARLEAVKEQLTPASPVHLPIDPRNYPIGEEINIPAAQIGDQQVFRSNGISITSVVPGNVRVMIDEIVEVDAEVQPPPDMRGLAAPPVFTPRKVMVRGPSKLLAPLGNGLKVYAELGRFEQLRTPGTHTLQTVQLQLPAELRERLNIELDQPVVQATVEISGAEIEGEISAVPVMVVVPPTLLDQITVDLQQQTIPNVKVVGPRELIDAMRKPGFPSPPIALLRIRPDDRTGERIERSVEYFLPPGIRVSAEDANRTVAFIVNERGLGG